MLSTGVTITAVVPAPTSARGHSWTLGVDATGARTMLVVTTRLPTETLHGWSPAPVSAAVENAAAKRITYLVTLRGRDARGLEALLRRQLDPRSPDRGRWLTPREFGRHFGAHARDLRRASRWLHVRGCRVRRLASRQLIVCTGARIGEIPPELGTVVTGVLGLDGRRAVETHLDAAELRPLATREGRFFLSPADFARVYGLQSLQAAGVDGGGQSIGIVALSRIDPADVAAFRSFFALPPPVLTQAGGIRSGDLREVEAVLDATWAGAIAPGARVHIAAGSQVVDALARLVNDPDIDVISLSIGLCKSPGNRNLIVLARRLFRQAAAQGQTVLVASGNEGPFTCFRRYTDPLASSPFVTAVGGTKPLPTLDASGNAIGYGSEAVWNEGGKASGGGVSSLRRPPYQRGRPRRTVPDVAFPAASLYPLGFQGRVGCCVGGTSAAAPAWAGVVALLNQAHGQRVGFLNPRLYELGRAQVHGGPQVFHDITEGSNAVGGVRGFAARPGYDLATGWGTLDGDGFFPGL